MTLYKNDVMYKNSKLEFMRVVKTHIFFLTNVYCIIGMDN